MLSFIANSQKTKAYILYQSIQPLYPLPMLNNVVKCDLHKQPPVHLRITAISGLMIIGIQ